MVVAVWLKKKSKPVWFVILPTVFMLAMTLWALIIVVGQYKLGLLGIIGIALLFLAALLIWESVKIMIKPIKRKEGR
jgi:carbon starvation protein CstA